MPLYYRLGNPGITSVSVDGRHHVVNADGLLEVKDEDLTPTLVREITGHFGGVQDRPENDQQTEVMNAAEADRQILFARLDVVFNRRIDRRKSMIQLQEMLADHEAKQARTEGATTALAVRP
jgi:hypothetical protein